MARVALRCNCVRVLVAGGVGGWEVNCGGGCFGGWRDGRLGMAEAAQLRLAGEERRASLGEPLLRADDAAQLLSVRTSWVYEAVRDGRLPCVRVGRHVRFLRDDL